MTMRWCLPFIVLAGLIGCADSVDPFVDSGRAYTVYGMLDAHADTQAMRIFEIAGTLEMIRSEPLNATVTSIEIGSGMQHQWRDSVVQFANGHFGHVYWAAFRGDYNKTYAVEVKRPDGVRTTARVTMPPAAEPIRLSPTLGDGYAVLPVLWRNAPRLHDIRISYETSLGTFKFDYPLDQQVRPEGVVVDIYLSRDAREIFRTLNRERIPITDLRLTEVILAVLVSSSDWVPPGGVYDPDVLIEPGVFSNVENGFGFVGAGYDTLLAFDPPDSVKVAAGIPVGN